MRTGSLVWGGSPRQDMSLRPSMLFVIVFLYKNLTSLTSDRLAVCFPQCLPVYIVCQVKNTSTFLSAYHDSRVYSVLPLCVYLYLISRFKNASCVTVKKNNPLSIDVSSLLHVTQLNQMFKSRLHRSYLWFIVISAKPA